MLADLPPNVIAYTPEFKEEAAEARKMRQQAIQKEVRRRNPQLNDLLNQDQLNAGDRGNKEQLMAVVRISRSGQARAWWLRCFLRRVWPISRSYAARAEFRRTPRQVVSEDLKEAKVFRALYSNRQLEEVLVDFWYNHFNVDIGKNVAPSAQSRPPAGREL